MTTLLMPLVCVMSLSLMMIALDDVYLRLSIYLVLICRLFWSSATDYGGEVFFPVVFSDHCVVSMFLCVMT
jgi:hypothetical protein